MPACVPMPMSRRTSFLSTIVAHKREEVARARAHEPEDELSARAINSGQRRDFIGALRAALASGRLAVIAELKKASPSAGVLCADYEPATIARDYASNGAQCLSVLTDRRFFQGSERDLDEARAACDLPVLRKDFILTSYQVHQSALMGADALLLIAAAFERPRELAELAQLATGYGMGVLLEIHNEEEWMQHASLAQHENILVGINNRDLRTFEVDMERTRRLAQRVVGVSSNPVVCESGIDSADQLRLMRSAGVRCFLIGSALMRATHPGKRLSSLLSEANRHGPGSGDGAQSRASLQ